MTVGIKPNNGGGPALVDQSWLLGLASGANNSYLNNQTATPGGAKAGAFQIPALAAMVSFATVASANDSALLPQAKAGTFFMFYNNAAANAMNLYGKGTDTINGAATANAYSVAAKVGVLFFSPLDGVWAAIKSA